MRIALITDLCNVAFIDIYWTGWTLDELDEPLDEIHW